MKLPSLVLSNSSCPRRDNTQSLQSFFFFSLFFSMLINYFQVGLFFIISTIWLTFTIHYFLHISISHHKHIPFCVLNYLHWSSLTLVLVLIIHGVSFSISSIFNTILNYCALCNLSSYSGSLNHFAILVCLSIIFLTASES